MLTGCVVQHVFQANTNKNCICFLWLQRRIDWNFPSLVCKVFSCSDAKLLSPQLKALSSILNVESFNLVLKGKINLLGRPSTQ